MIGMDYLCIFPVFRTHGKEVQKLTDWSCNHPCILDPSTTKLVMGISIPVQLIAYGLVAWFFHKVSKK